MAFQVAREFSLMPFWFWNDRLDEAEFLRQIADFEEHGVYGFVIHPRMGLPRDIGWMSDALLGYMQIAIEEAARRDMRVMLYDEGMYPSGSSSGQVVAEDPSLACRCLALLKPGEVLPRSANVVARVRGSDGGTITVIDKPADSYIRGVHYLDEEKNIEDEPAAGDILNPKTAAAVLRLVYQRFFDRFGKHFGKTIIGIFTDEPNPLGKARDSAMRPGTTGIVEDVSSRLGYDFTPHLPALWFGGPEGESDAQKYRADYDWAIRRRLEETWYGPLSNWCEEHGIALCGHPDRGDEIGVQRYFHIPGQDLVWRWVQPGNASALEGPESTQAKGASSAMIHYGRRRNSNEFCGAYGHETTFDEFKWLANWCLVRGANLLIPHAFYYSVRGPRRDERPPQVGGVGCAWWGEFKGFADHCRFVCWLNTDSKHLCAIAILTTPDHCPWSAAKVCYEHQFDFNYLDVTLLEKTSPMAAAVDTEGIHLAGMSYNIVILDGEIQLSDFVKAKLLPLMDSGRVVSYISGGQSRRANEVGDSGRLTDFLVKNARRRFLASPGCPDLRIRETTKGAIHFALFFNEGAKAISAELSADAIAPAANPRWIDTVSGAMIPAHVPLRIELPSHGMAVLAVDR